MALKFAFKVAVVSSAVYWTNQLEVWSPLSPNKREYDQLIANAKQYLKKNQPESLKFELPNVINKDLCSTTNYYYNRGVLNTFDYVAHLPSNVRKLYEQVSAKLSTLNKK